MVVRFSTGGVLVLSLHQSVPQDQCLSIFVRPRPGKFFFHKTRAGSQQIYSYITFYFLSSYIKLAYLLTYLLTPRCRILLEKLTGLQLVKKFPAFHGTRRFITALTSVRHLSLSCASPIQSTYPHPTSWRSILILSIHLRLGLHSGLLPSGFPTKTLYTPISSPIRATCPAHLIPLDFITRTILGEEYSSMINLHVVS